MSEADELRIRQPTEKGTEQFLERVQQHMDKIKVAWATVQKELDVEVHDDFTSLRQLNLSVDFKFRQFRRLCSDYSYFLDRTRTEDSMRRLREFSKYNSDCEYEVQLKLQDIANRLQDIANRQSNLELDDSKSVHSKSSRKSKSSSISTSSSLAAKAKLQAAKARMVVSRKELELKKKQAMLVEEKTTNMAKAECEERMIKAELDMLNDEKELAQAEAENEVYETVSECMSSDRKSRDLHVDDTYERTRQYVMSQSEQDVEDKNFKVRTDTPCATLMNSTAPKVKASILDPVAPAFSPRSIQEEFEISKTLGQFLVKKDLLLTRFVKFQDDPVTYYIWKETFKNITTELGCSASEEVDLLSKWLGPDSSRQATNIRVSNAHDPEAARSKIWERLEERFGSPEMVENSLRKKLDQFPRLSVKEYRKLFDLCDIVAEIESVKDNPLYSNMLGYFDSPVGVNVIVNKLPVHIQNKWADRGRKYKTAHCVSYPPFDYFVKFLREMSSFYNDPSFNLETAQRTTKDTPRQSTNQITTKKGDVSVGEPKCPIHTYAQHNLDSCREFSKMTIEKRRQLLKEKKLCFKCCSDKHTIKECNASIRCKECGSSKHITALHITRNQSTAENRNDLQSGREGITAKCSKLCGDSSMSKSCAKIIKVVVYHKDVPNDRVPMYALIDDQSNRTLAMSSFFEHFEHNFTFKDTKYSLSTCSGNIATSGRLGEGFIIEGQDEKTLELPCITECSEIPDNRNEIPTPDVARKYPHLKRISEFIPEIDDQAEIQLLIGRDLAEAHHVHEQLIGPQGPYAQKLSLGWVLIGETCIGQLHVPSPSVNVKKTHIHKDGRQSIFSECENKFTMKHNSKHIEDNLTGLFVRTREDNKLGLSVEDREFLSIMDKECVKNEDGYWSAPLPFRPNRQNLPYNRDVALKRAKYLDASLKRNSTKADHFMTFMAKVIDSGAAEIAPPPTGKETWYLPIFGVYHPKKPDKIRGVFDSSAVCKGISLNSVLLSGPNSVNSLLHILLRFRKDEIAVIADIEQMFYSFYVKLDHRDYLRFFWYRDNDTSKDLIEYRMCAHVFGNSPSPAVATFGLRKTVEDAEDDVKNFVGENFYVDDGLVSLPETDNVIDLVKRTQKHLQTANLRLHKIASNSKAVMKAFPQDDLQNDLRSLNFDEDMLPINRSLGLSWDLNTDNFKFNSCFEQKPYTRRGLLSTLNSVFDPLGFVSPLTIRGKLLWREITSGADWDEPLEPDLEMKWKVWKESLLSLDDVFIPRMYVAESLSRSSSPELHIFSDASEKAVSAVAYIRVCDKDSVKSVGFVMGKSKIAPSSGHTIPRLELCAALLAAEIGDIIVEALKVKFNTVKFYSDSRVVLGYICNTTRRFYNYVSNRIQKILQLSEAKQWNYINTKSNPADIGSRGCSSTDQLKTWLQGPEMLYKRNVESFEEFSMISPNEDKDVRAELTTNKTLVIQSLSQKFDSFSSWKRLVAAIVVLKRAIKSFKAKKQSGKDDIEEDVEDLIAPSEKLILKLDQERYFWEELKSLADTNHVNRNSPIVSLNPFLDNDGLIRVGGRLGRSCLQIELTNPIVLSGRSHIATLLVRHFHEKIKHQGRHLTEGAIRSSGYWIIGAKRLVSSLIHKCVVCRKLRGKTEHQIMAELPTDRLTPGPPFSYVGVDVFGPWQIVSRRTRGGMAQSKRWAVLFTCMTTRAVHIEVIEEMSSSSFINALRRFISLRGNVVQFRSDRGTNFVGATEELKFNVINVEDGKVSDYLRDSHVTWRFNAPHSSHMGGVWERMIGIARRILDGILQGHEGVHAKNLSHEVLVTLMAEVVAVMNSRPIAPISSDADCPVILSPATLLNQKINGDSSMCFDLDIRDLYKKQWKMVQVLSDMFWKQWRDSFLQTLQPRRKWQTQQICVKNGDVVLLKDKQVPRNEWPVGIVTNAIKSDGDKLVRKAEIRVCKYGKCTTYTRPVTEMVILVE